MDNVPFWLIAVIMLGLLILVHELGHYLTGRLFGFKINEFSVGMGPKIISKKSKKTDIRYSLRGIPLGGFVAFAGEDGESNDPRAMNNMPWQKRAVVFFAGAGMNILFAFLAVAVLTASIGYNAAKIETVDSASSLSGIAEKGDIVYALNGEQMLSVGQFAGKVSEANGEMTLTIIRNGEKKDIVCAKTDIGGKKLLGITYSNAEMSQNIFQAFLYSAKYNVWMAKTLFATLGQLVTGKIGTEVLSGPFTTIGQIGSIVKDATSYQPTLAQKLRDASVIITELLSIISINLAVMNLLPIPALDGFKLLTVIIEGITKKKLPEKVEFAVNAAGFVLLFGAMILLEITKLI